MSPRIQWLTPSPLWGELAASADKGPFRGPALLRFSTDQFMEELQGLLAKTPEALRNYVAQPETWRKPAVGMDAVAPAASVPSSSSSTTTAGKAEPQLPFKFFQPVHARFYLVSASLVCRLPGLPDHEPKTSQGERTTFVLRRLRPKSGVSGVDCSVFDPQRCDEYAWVLSGDRSGWARVTGAGLVKDEEKLPMFGFQYGANGTRRRTFAGLIPVSRRQTYVAGREIQAQPQVSGNVLAVQPEDPRKIEVQRQVLDPWAELLDYSVKTNQSTPPLPQKTLGQISIGMAQGSAFILIDFANFLSRYLPDVWNAVQNPSQASLHGKQLDLYNKLGAKLVNYYGSSSSLADGIRIAKSYESTFESAVLATGPTQPLPAGYPGPMLATVRGPSDPDPEPQLTTLIARGSDPLKPRPIQAAVEAALDEVGAAPPSITRVPAKDPENPQGDDWYIVRCVYEQPQCGLNALPILSEPSRPFQLASFFDADAPARPVQVALPVDTTPAALRKYDKGVAFMISDQLGKQMSRVKGLKQLMEGDLADPNGFGLGMICSFSIPIITICAFIVLMIFLVLLNIIFWWLPFFKICFPLPTFKAKGS